LQVTGVSGPAYSVQNESGLVTWTDVNAGNGAAAGTWVDNVYLATDAQGDNRTLLGSFPFTGGLAAGGSA
jgi:hypothetical protein